MLTFIQLSNYNLNKLKYYITSNIRVIEIRVYYTWWW